MEGKSKHLPPKTQVLPNREEIRRKITENLKGIKHKIIILSGKGGVGKSAVTANLAAVLAKKGYSVGVFDYDLHGPAMARMLGVLGKTPPVLPIGIFPATGVLGVKVFSIAFLLPDERTPVIWRGPLKLKALQELMCSIVWGEMDFLLFDLPPGTGDEALNIAQNIPNVEGAIVVTIPSVVSTVAVEKSVKFCKKLNIELLGVIENMSYFRCPYCGQITEIFGKKAGERIAQDENIRLLGKIPLDPEMAGCMDKGAPMVICKPDSESTKSFETIAQSILRLLS